MILFRCATRPLRSSISFGGRLVFLFVVRFVVRLFANPYTCTCDSVTPLSLRQARATLLQTPPKRGASRQLDGTDDLSDDDMSDGT